jgi:Fur family transcriptional regulator, ferric uptake regulator
MVSVASDAEEYALRALKERGYRMTPQRRAIVGEIMRIEGHIAPASIAQRVKDRLPGVNDSTVYRTLELLEELGILAHTHLGSGAEYHHASHRDHVHLVCESCGREQDIGVAETASLQRQILDKSGFLPDFTHFAISGLCERCRSSRSAQD